MTVTLELEPDVEEGLRRQANTEGQEFSVYLAAVLRRAAHSPSHSPSSWPDGYFEKTYGAFQDAPLERLPQGAYEERESLD